MDLLPKGKTEVPDRMMDLIEETAVKADALDTPMGDDLDDVLMPDEEGWITVTELAKRLAVSAASISTHLNNGTIPFEERGGKRMVLESVADAIAELRRIHGRSWMVEWKAAQDGVADEDDSTESTEVFVSGTELKERAQKLLKEGRFEAAAHFYDLLIEQYAI